MPAQGRPWAEAAAPGPVVLAHGPVASDADAPAIAAVVVLYRPDSRVLENLASLADQVARIYVVDNTEAPDVGLVQCLASCPMVAYHANHANLGIATALNLGVRAAMADGYVRLLTMDQDSTATSGMVAALGSCMDSDTRIGLVSPVHQQVGADPREVEPGSRDVLKAMTSGNLVRAEAYLRVGGFMEELFIDQVDNEFCLKLHRAGFRVVESGDAVLHHRVGEVRRHSFPWPCFTTNHSAVRRYYMTRNRLVVGAMYSDDHPEYRAFELRQLAREVVKILLYEKHKWLKIAMILRGFRDYRRGVLGPYPGR